MSGVLVLTLSTVIVKIIGLAYKIPLMATLDAEGMGYFNTAYEIFALLCGVSTTGVPVAVSILVSSSRQTGNTARAAGVYKTASAILLTKGVLFSGALAVLAEPIAHAVGNPQAYFAILAISPSLLFCSVSGAVRGYFQGCRIMTPTAISQLIEALGKLLLGVSFAYLGVRGGYSIPTCAAFALLGVSLGSLLSATYLFVRKQRELSGELSAAKKNQRVRKYFFPLLRISLPITLCSMLVGTTRIIDMTFLLRRLGEVGINTAEANRIYGAYTTLALPVFTLVPALIPPITESLIPRLAGAVESANKQEQQRAVSGALRLTLFVAAPASLGIAIYSKEILTLLFPAETAAISLCAPMLSALAVSVLFSCLVSTANAVLQSYGRVLLPIASLLAGALVKAVSAYFLIANPAVAEMGAPISTSLGNAAVLMLDALFVKKVTSAKAGLVSQMIRPIFAASVAMGLSWGAYKILLHMGFVGTPAFLCAFAIAAGAYVVLCVCLGVVGKEDVAMFKKRDKILHR